MPVEEESETASDILGAEATWPMELAASA